MELPPYLLDQVKDGNVVILMGAGASVGARNSKGECPPTGQELSRLIADKFLGSSHRDDPLAFVSELAISESDLFTFQEFVRIIFEDFQPDAFHQLLPSFSWHGLATTNFALVIERAYAKTNHRVQDLVPFIKNGDRVEERLKSLKGLPYLKLHGCITQTADENTRLIITVDQYLTYREGRSRVFGHLLEWAYEHPIVFVGHSLSDPDIRHMLQELGKADQRPRFFTVTPTLSEPEKRLWEGRRVTALQGTFEDLLQALDNELPSVFRGVVVHTADSELPISERFVVRDRDLGVACKDFLDADVEYVRLGMPSDTIPPELFYRGYNGKWSPIEQNHDVRRGLADTILSDVILGNELGTTDGLDLIVIKGHAGFGKSVLLRRIAWEAAITYEKLCLFRQDHGRIAFEPLREIYQLTNERIFLFIDNAGEIANALGVLARRVRREKLPITIICSERHNEWNMACEALNEFVTEDYDVRYLSSKEINELLELLERHRSLGTLERATPEERKKIFVEGAGRQLLVALHEATLGKPFEDIIADEYAEIRPKRAQEVYLAVCVLNRLDVPVRAGLIARSFGISFTDFQENFFQPLERVVLTAFDKRTRDHTYSARHPHIAQIVFDRILLSIDDRYRMYVDLLNALNIDYDSDRSAFRKLIRGRSLVEVLPEHRMVEDVYNICQTIAPDDPYLYHQMAIYEMQRSGGNLLKARDYLQRAKQLAPNDNSITHSIAELLLSLGLSSHTQLEFDSRLDEAERLVDSITGPYGKSSYAFHTLAKIGNARIEKMLHDTDDELDNARFMSLVRNTEEIIQKGLQEFPDYSYLRDAEARLSDLISDEDRAVAALKSAFESDRSNPFIAMRLARQYSKLEDVEAAKNVFQQAVEAGVEDRRLRFNYAKLLLDTGSSDAYLISHNLRRAFVQGDQNYEAQFWYARQLYVNSDISESQSYFYALRRAPIAPDLKRKLRGVLISEDGSALRFRGRVFKQEDSYALIARDGPGDPIFLHVTNVEETLWSELTLNLRLVFSIGFTFGGANAFDVKPE